MDQLIATTRSVLNVQKNMELVLILGNQLFDPTCWPQPLRDVKNVFMREDRELCTYYQFHKHKIIFFLAAMRSYRDELQSIGIDVHYEKMSKGKTDYEQSLLTYLRKSKIKKVHLFEIEDKFFETRLIDLLKSEKISHQLWASPMFLTGRAEFKQYLTQYKKPFMKNFYEKQRKNLKILVDAELNPVGGQWSFDEDNRLPLPAKISPPERLEYSEDENIFDAKKICEEFFGAHPGQAEDFWLPVKRKQAVEWLNHFLKMKLVSFGAYEDALAPHSDFVFHSVLTPFLNSGLLTPAEVIEATLKTAKKQAIPLSSLEGFVRQIIGWREFIRGIYQNFSDVQETKNFWNHQRKLSKLWYQGGSPIPQLERTLNKVFKFGYCHHIERLMVLGNLMLLLEIHPAEAHRWFMEMFVDSSDWVMGPNVYGMALFSDGGIFATKPYICGSNYWRKMSKEPAGDWCDGVDGLYWRFIEKNRSFFSKNPRLSMMVKSLDKMDPARKEKIYRAANLLQDQLTESKAIS